MKRIGLHILFWLAYTVQDILLMFLWMEPALPGVPEKQGYIMAAHAALVILIPKLFLTYYILYVTIPKMLRENSKLAVAITELVLVLIVSIILYRAIFRYYVGPIIYTGYLKPHPLLEIRRVLQTIMDIGFVTGAAVTIKLLRIQLAAKEREKNLTKEKLETELKFLRNQTNPHFLFNTLNNIYALARKKSDDTAQVVMKLSKILRFMLYESKKKRITIAEEIWILNDYLELEKIRYNNRLTVRFQKQIDDDTQPIAPLLLLPLIENAFKHGVSETRFDSFIHIDMQLQRGFLSFNIENTKENGSTDAVTDNIGLSNIRRQLELMYKEYKIVVENHKDIFKVNLAINLSSHAEI